ncbi:ABC transporter ATP-binding protein [Acetobacterium tundrae]|uniref:ATP-binding cassette domain-containing protein n=1 Tax=Acetobacterium tundrae TaxID=132932 RepID=A0ABR6WHD5_9FIRM|nr:ABC transporter ATP-binding protein [Acetobacterium tundrae]MBC3795552.1 ATP-binding cassette domain-containing protein [Acetobacterium tundrae]
MIETRDITLKYSGSKGIFDLNFKVEKGEAFGYIGPKGAGKTSTIRVLMGLSHSSKGLATINGLNCFNKAAAIQKITGYIPEQTSFFDGMRVKEYLNFISRMRGSSGSKKTELRDSLIERFELETRGKIENLSNDMKQKLAIVTAFMHDPEVLILDEPTNGLDPLMQSRFVDLIIEEKRQGKTILMATHMFENVERTCDRVGILKEGRIVAQDDIIQVKSAEIKSYFVRFEDHPNLEQLKKYGFGYKQFSEKDYEILCQGDRIDALVKVLSHEKVLVFNSNTQTLEEIFQKYYSKEAINA